jgi:nucleoside-diphosphate-sugar epimerase
MTRYLITGATGMLGRDLQLALAGRDVTSFTKAELDVTDLDAVLTATAGYDVMINASAYTKVDDAETNEDAAYAINAIGPHNLALAAAATSAKLVQVSTDYVFDGSATEPYSEDTLSNRSRPMVAPRPPGDLRARYPPVRKLHRSHGMALRRARDELSQDDAKARGGAGHTRRRQRPGRPAHLGG